MAKKIYNSILIIFITIISINRFYGNIYIVTNTNDVGLGSLRQAIINANSNPSYDTIIFNIPGKAPHDIKINTELPTLTNNGTIIDGTTQPANGFTGISPKIILNGINTSSGNGLQIRGNYCKIFGLYITKFKYDGIEITGNFFTIGGPKKGNVISGNNYNQVDISSDYGGVIKGNIIGLDTTGTSIPPESLIQGKGYEGINILTSRNIIIGGPNADDRNIISGNEYNGIQLGDGSGFTAIQGCIKCTIENNFIGTDISSTIALRNNYYGIEIIESDSVLIKKNVISGNNYGGIGSGYVGGFTIMKGFNNSVIEENLIGTDSSGTIGVGNKSSGIRILGSNNINILNNVISKNSHGIYIGCDNSYKTATIINGKIQGNKIGTDISGSINLGNNSSGITIYGVTYNFLIGGLMPNNSNTIAYNGTYGIVISDTALNNEISNNSIYCNKSGGINLLRYGNNQYPAPVIYGKSSSLITGTANPNDTVEIFYDDSCQYCQGKQFIALVKADALGNWTYTHSTPFTMDIAVTSTQQANGRGNTSAFNCSLTPPLPPKAKFTVNDSTLCSGQCINFSDFSTGNGITSWRWSFPGASVNSSTQKNPTNICYNSPGSYNVQLIVENAAGIDTLTKTNYIIVIPPPIVSVNPDTIICPNTSIQLTASGGIQYSWSPSNTLSSSSISNPIATPNQTTLYIVTITDNNGCSNSDSVLVNVYPAITISSRVTPSSQWECTGSVIMNISSGTPNYSYLWSSNDTSKNLSQVCAGIYTITVTDSKGCSTTHTVNVSALTIKINAYNDTTICKNSSVLLHASASGGTLPYSFYWDNGATGSSITIMPDTQTTYKVYAIDSTGYFSDTASITVSIFPPISFTATTINDTVACSGMPAVITLQASGGSGSNYTFLYNNYTINSPFTLYPDTTQQYIFTVSNLCGSINDTLSIYVDSVPIVNFISDSTMGCQPLTITFIETSGNSYSSYSWNFGDGKTNLSTSNSITHQYTNAGTYNVTLQITTQSGCHANKTIQKMITVFAKPKAIFYATPSTASLVNPIIYFENISQQANSYLWDFGDNNQSTQESPNHQYKNTGKYIVTLYAISHGGCFDTASNQIEIAELSTLFMPNAFTPNGDNENDIFLPSANNIDTTDVQLIIYDRWGEKVFETHNGLNGWNGTINRSTTIGNTGLYTWIIIYREAANHKQIIKTGTVMLIR